MPYSAASISVTINESSGSEASFHITNPFQNQTIENLGAPYTVVVEVPDAGEVNYMEITAQNLWTGATTVIGSTSSPSSITSIPWTLGADAKYQLVARASTKTGGTLESVPVVVTVTTPVSSGISILPSL